MSGLDELKNNTSIGRKNYFDDFSRFIKIYFIKTKYEAGNMFFKYKAEVENQLDKKIKRLRLDKGGECGDNFLKDFC